MPVDKPANEYKAAQLAEELGIDPAELRKHLRALNVKKPEKGWVWDKKTNPELAEIRKSVKARIKELEDAAKKVPAKTEAKKPAKKAAAKAEGEAPVKTPGRVKKSK